MASMARKRSPREIPPRLELECLKVLWSEGGADGARVRQLLHARELAYTTIVTLLERLVDRGAASRQKVGRRFVYSPSVEIGSMRTAALRVLLADYFGGSERELRSFLDGGPPVEVAVEPAVQAGGMESPRIDTALL